MTTTDLTALQREALLADDAHGVTSSIVAAFALGNQAVSRSDIERAHRLRSAGHPAAGRAFDLLTRWNALAADAREFHDETRSRVIG